MTSETSAWVGPGSVVDIWADKWGDEDGNLSVDWSVNGSGGLDLNDNNHVYRGIAGDTTVHIEIFEHDGDWHSHDSTFYTFSYDSTPPSFSLISSLPVNTWISPSTPVVYINGLGDGQSGVNRVLCSIDGAGEQVYAPNTNSIAPSFSTTGIHYVSIRAVDNVGNVSATQTLSYYIDATIPDVPGVTLSLGSKTGADGEPHLSVIQGSWSVVSDAHSGLNRYIVGHDPATGSFVALEPTFYPSNPSGTVSVPLGGNRNYSSPHRMRIGAWDNVGNAATGVASSLLIPPPLTVNKVEASPVPEAATGDNLVSITLSCTPSQMLSYDSLRMVRLSGDPAKPLPEAMTSAPLNFATSSVVDPDGHTLRDPSHWSTDSQGNLVYTDRLPASTGAGHRKIQYKVYAWIQGVQEYGNTSTPVMLANHQGTVAFEVQDVEGHVFGSPDFLMGPDHVVNLVFQGSDPDQETWYYDLERVVRKRQPPDYTTVLTAYRKLTGDDPIEYQWDNGYGKVVKPIRLTLGANNIQAFWREGLDGTEYATSSFDSDIITLTVDNNGLSVTSGGGDAEYDNNGLVVHPGEPLDFMISVPGVADLTEIQWDFGDGTTGEGPNILQKKYHQAEDQTGPTYGRSLVVTLPGGTQMQLAVAVTDTQEGSLYESEVWKGNHRILGVVRVPQGLALTVARQETITMEGGLGSGYAQGLDIRGTLMVGDQVWFKKLDSQIPGWGTILITGNAIIGRADISGADRGITVGPGATVTLTGTSLHDNLTGLHVVGISSVTVDQATISNNSVYGIKEDARGRPWVTNSTIGITNPDLVEGSTNYYSSSDGPLGIGEVNLLTTTINGQSVQNTGNQGE